MKTIILAISLFFVSALSSEGYSQHESTTYTVVVNLDDRLTEAGQVDRDKDIIKLVFSKFKNDAKRKYFIKSKDHFRVLFSPQSGSKPYYQYEERLSINLNNFHMAKKRKAVENFEQELSNILDQVYNEAYKGQDKSLYHGADLWRFFNDDLGFILQKTKTSREKVFILSDGYIDFESEGSSIQIGNQFTNTSFINSLKSYDEPFEKIESEGWGLIPLDVKLSKCEIAFMEMNPKSDYLFETRLLSTVWENWFSAMHVVDFEAPRRVNISEMHAVITK